MWLEVYDVRKNRIDSIHVKDGSYPLDDIRSIRRLMDTYPWDANSRPAYVGYGESIEEIVPV